MFDEHHLDAAVRSVATIYGGRFADWLCWMATYIPICGENSPYLRRVQDEYARIANG